MAGAFVAIIVLGGLVRLQAALEISEDRELIELNLSAWNCVKRAAGSGRSTETVERNTLKNRWAVNLSMLAVKSFDTASFLQHLAEFDVETKALQGGLLYRGAQRCYRPSTATQWLQSCVTMK